MIQYIEISVYLLIAALLFAYRTVISGKKNGCFYHKNDNPLPPKLKRSIENIHFVETPAWYVQSIAVFFIILAMQRMGYPTLCWWKVGVQAAISFLFMVGTYQMPSYYFQKWLTAWLRDDDHLDAINESEVAIMIFGYKIQFWKGRLFSNRRRKLAQWLGVIWIVSAIGLLIWFNLIR